MTNQGSFITSLVIVTRVWNEKRKIWFLHGVFLYLYQPTKIYFYLCHVFWETIYHKNHGLGTPCCLYAIITNSFRDIWHNFTFHTCATCSEKPSNIGTMETTFCLYSLLDISLGDIWHIFIFTRVQRVLRSHLILEPWTQHGASMLYLISLCGIFGTISSFTRVQHFLWNHLSQEPWVRYIMLPLCYYY